MEMQALRQALLILSRRVRRPPNLAVGAALLSISELDGHLAKWSPISLPSSLLC